MISTRTPLYPRWLWWKHTWTFQLAHKPLCSRFHQDVLCLGSLRVCRSCAAMYGGFGGMIFAALLGGTGRIALPGALLLIAALVVAVFSAPAFYPRSSRYARDVLRGAAGMLAAQGTLLLATSEWPYGMGLLALLAGAWIAFHRMAQKHPHEADGCGGCPEHGREGVCSGFTHQAACLRGYEEEATAWLDRHYARPGSTHT